MFNQTVSCMCVETDGKLCLSVRLFVSVCLCVCIGPGGKVCVCVCVLDQAVRCVSVCVYWTRRSAVCVFIDQLESSEF